MKDDRILMRKKNECIKIISGNLILVPKSSLLVPKRSGSNSA